MPSSPPPIPGCTDVPGWKDADGDVCSSYSRNEWCTSSGEEGRGWHEEWGHFASFTNAGLTGLTACCACGGGNRTKVPAPLDKNAGTSGEKKGVVDDDQPGAPMVKVAAVLILGAGLIGFGCWYRKRDSESNSLDTKPTRYGKKYASMEDDV